MISRPNAPVPLVGLTEAQSEADRGPFYAYVRVTSHEVRLAEITQALGIAADESHDIGDPNPYRAGGIYKWCSWSMYLGLNGEISMGTEGLSEAIEALGGEFADKLAELGRRSCEVALMVVQVFDVDDDDQDTGVHVTASAVRWLARAGAFLDIDQYIG